MILRWSYYDMGSTDNTRLWTSTAYQVYNPDTHELVPKKSHIEAQIKEKEEEMERIAEAETNYIKRTSELSKTIKEEIKSLKEQLKED